MDHQEAHDHGHDLTSQFLDAARCAEDWTPQAVRCALDAIRDATPGTAIDWEEEEGWGRVTQKHDVIAYVCAWLPLIVTRRGALPPAARASAGPVVVIEVEDMARRAFSIDPATLMRLYHFPTGAAFDPRNFSMDELWYCTV